MGRNPIEFDMEKVEELAGLGLTQEEIALSLGISVSTIKRRKNDNELFELAIKKGKASSNKLVANALFERAKAGDIPAGIWWEKTRAGRSDKTVTQNFNVDLSQLSTEQLERLANGEELLSVLRS